MDVSLITYTVADLTKAKDMKADEKDRRFEKP